MDSICKTISEAQAGNPKRKAYERDFVTLEPHSFAYVWRDSRLRQTENITVLFDCQQGVHNSPEVLRIDNNGEVARIACNHGTKAAHAEQ